MQFNSVHCLIMQNATHNYRNYGLIPDFCQQSNIIKCRFVLVLYHTLELPLYVMAIKIN